MKYHLTYKVEHHPDGLEPKEVKKDPERGACTAILIGSLLYPTSGAYSALFITRDGRTGEPLEPKEIWKAWVMLAKELADTEGLPHGKRELASEVWEVVAAAMADIRSKG